MGLIVLVPDIFLHCTCKVQEGWEKIIPLRMRGIVQFIFLLFLKVFCFLLVFLLLFLYLNLVLFLIFLDPRKRKEKEKERKRGIGQERGGAFFFMGILNNVQEVLHVFRDGILSTNLFHIFHT